MLSGLSGDEGQRLRDHVASARRESLSAQSSARPPTSRPQPIAVDDPESAASAQGSRDGRRGSTVSWAEGSVVSSTSGTTPGFFSGLFPTPAHARRSESDRSFPGPAMDASTPLTSISQCFLLPPEDSVYSYFMFLPPIDQRRTKKYLTPLIFLGFVLVAVNFVMQVGLLAVVGDYIRKTHNDWVSSIVHLKNPAWYHVVPMPYNLPPPTCHNENSAMCIEKGDGISCAPATIHLLTDWSLLDSDGDGVWSREEAAAEHVREQVHCDYGVDLLQVYNSISSSLNASDIFKGRRDTDLFSGIGVNKAYFNWFLHKPLLCQYGDADMCGPLFQRGFFDEALRQQSLPDFTDSNAALRYCTKLLQQECFDILPTTYKVWTSRRNQQCGERVYGQSMYHVPDGVSDVPFGGGSAMLTVGFKIQDIYKTTNGYAFRMFLCILLVTFLSVMFLEMRSIVKTFTWAIMFPADHEGGRGKNIVGKDAVRIRWKEPSGDDEPDLDNNTMTYTETMQFESMQKTILRVRTDHRLAVTFVTVLRVLLWVFLLWSGIMFLTGQPRYLTLIFDALSLVFIFEIDELLYKTMLRHELKVDHMSIDDIRVTNIHHGWLSGRKTVYMDILSFLGIIAFAFCIMHTYCSVELNPIHDALTCLCSRDGPRCYAAQKFSKPWWDNYWSTTLPAANLIIDRLKVI